MLKNGLIFAVFDKYSASISNILIVILFTINLIDEVFMKNLRINPIGILIVTTIALLATLLSTLSLVKDLGFSPLVVGIVIGIFYANTLSKSQPKEWGSGIEFSAKKILRFAIVIYGFRVTISQILDVGLEGFLMSLFMVVSTFLIGTYAGLRLFGLDRDTAMLTASGASVCGAAAVLATEPVLKAKEHKVAIAVSMVVLFGTIAMFLYPFLYSLIFSKVTGFFHLSPEEFGIYVGGSIHEVAQVVAVSTLNGADTAMAHNGVIVKLTRVLLIAPMLIILSIYLSKSSKNSKEKMEIVIPWFAVYFIFVVIFNSFELLPKNLVDTINTVDTFLLTMAMSALGMQTDFKKFRGFGLAPFYTALVMFIWLVVGGFLAIKVISAVV